MFGSLRRLAQTFLEKLRWLLTIETHEFYGISLHVHTDADESCLEKVTKALDLIWEFDPVKYKSIFRLLPGGIAIDEPKAVSAEYLHERKMCYLNFDYVKRYHSEDISLTIVHELCHARLMSHGIGYTEGIRLRVEKACIRRELAFAIILDLHYEGEDYFVNMIKSVQENISPENYTDAAFQMRARRNLLLRLRSLKDLGIPGILRRCAVVRHRRRRLREGWVKKSGSA
ncbi:MAG: hypothetical protein AAGD13_12265 [Pseudomonadota bacterium]